MDRQPLAPQRRHFGTRQISAIEVQGGQRPGLARGFNQSWHRFVLGTIGWHYRGTDDEPVRDDDMAFVALDRLGLALATMAHLRISDGNHAVFGNAISNTHSAAVRI